MAGAGGSTLSGDLSLCITCLTFPLTIFSLYYKNQDRRGLRPLLLYIPGGLMMCQYVVLGAISDHCPSQAYIKDSIRLYNFTFYEQILGIIVTIVANLWNASLDTTVLKYIKDKGWFERSDRSCWDTIRNICCGPKDKAEEEGEELQATGSMTMPVNGPSTIRPNSTKTKQRVWKSAGNHSDA